MTEATTSRDDTRTRIVEVAATLLHEHGEAAMTTRRVAEEAGVQAPTIYRLFGDKDGLLETVAEHVLATYVSTKAEVVQAANDDDIDPIEDLRAGWDTQMDFGIAHPTLFTFLNDPARGLRSPAVAAGMEVLRARIHRVALTGRLRVSEQRAVNLVHAAGTGTITAILSTPPERRDPGLADAMIDAVLRHLLTDAPTDAPTSPTAAAMAATVAFRAVAADLDALTEAERQLLMQWLDRAISAAD